MKRAFGWCLAWVLFGIGHVTSMLIASPREWPTDRIVYQIYSAFMRWSLFVQDWSGADSPWSKP